MKAATQHLLSEGRKAEIFEGDLDKQNLSIVLSLIKDGQMYVARTGSWSGQRYFKTILKQEASK